MAAVVPEMAIIDPVRPAFISRQVREARLFFRDLRPAARGPLRVVCGGLERCAPDYCLDRRGFTYMALEFVWSGRAADWWRGRAFTLGLGTVFAYGPRVAHRVVADPRHPPVKYFVDFTGREAKELAAPLLSRGPGRCARPEVVRWLFEELIRAGMRPGHTGDLRCAAVLRTLLLTLADEVGPAVPQAAVGQATFLRVSNLIEQHALEIPNLRALAHRAGLDAAYVCRLFRRHGGESPYHALQRVRFARAAEVLQRPGTRVKEAAAAIGMADPYQFSRSFKRLYGLSPQAFQQYRRGEVAAPENR